MIPNNISFTNFEVTNPRAVVSQHLQNKAAFWPLEWTLVQEPHRDGLGLTEVNIYAWFRRNCEHRWDISQDTDGRRIFAFEDDGEAALFLLSF